MSTTIAILTTEFIPFLIICVLENCGWQQLFEPNFEARAAPRTKPEQSGGTGLSEIGDQGTMAAIYIDILIHPISTMGQIMPTILLLNPQILRASYGPESCRSPKSSASATLYASSCWKFIADDDRNTTKARNPGKCKVIGIPKFSKPLSNHQIKMGLNPFSRSISIGMNLRLSAKMSEEKTDIGLT